MRDPSECMFRYRRGQAAGLRVPTRLVSMHRALHPRGPGFTSSHVLSGTLLLLLALFFWKKKRMAAMKRRKRTETDKMIATLALELSVSGLPENISVLRLAILFEPIRLLFSSYRVSKKTEFCQIEHLQILLVFGEKYLMKFVANPVVSCFVSAISMLLLGAL